eukprot:scaffold2698_cov135-Skeletonema_dohrnii-CCMP3373.AAC.4
MRSKQGFLAPLSPTSVSQMASFVAVADNQLKGILKPADGCDDQNQACLCHGNAKENNIVTFANLFDYEDNQAICLESATKDSFRVSFADVGDIGHILGLKKRISVPQGCTINDDDAVVSKASKKRSVSFAPSCQVIQLVDNQTEGREHELWYSRYDFMLFEDEACLCSHLVQQSETQGTFDGELGHVLGLEKIILCDSYFDRRDTLRKAVMDEQAVQQMVKEERTRQGYESTDDISRMQLANTSERFSLWARERASMAAFALEHDLATQSS